MQSISRLATSSTPAVIRIQIQYQDLSGISTAGQTALKSAVDLMILAIQKYIKVGA